MFYTASDSKQKGSALLITLLVLVAVSILGIACIHSSIIELAISSNERQMRENFYLAESAAMEGIQRLVEAKQSEPKEQRIVWQHTRQRSEDQPRFRDPGQWRHDGGKQDNCLRSPIDPEVYMTVLEWKVAAASSLVMTESRLYENRVYGLCSREGADNLIEIGYQLRY